MVAVAGAALALSTAAAAVAAGISNSSSCSSSSPATTMAAAAAASHPSASAGARSSSSHHGPLAFLRPPSPALPLLFLHAAAAAASASAASLALIGPYGSTTTSHRHGSSRPRPRRPAALAAAAANPLLSPSYRGGGSDGAASIHGLQPPPPAAPQPSSGGKSLIARIPLPHAVRSFLAAAGALFAKFGLGMAALFLDGKRALEAWKRLRAIAAGHPSLLSDRLQAGGAAVLELRREYRLVLETLRAFLQLLPLIIIWIPPIIGFLPPILFCIFPRELYTRHFHNEADRARFALFQDGSRRAHFPQLRSLCAFAAAAATVAGTTTGGGGPRGGSEAGLFSQPMPGPTAGNGSWDVKEGVAAARALFAADGPLSLERLPSTHLRCLARANHITKFDWLCGVLPPFYLRRRLRRRANELAIDDALLRRASFPPNPQLLAQSLSWDELREACDLRGLPAAAAPAPINDWDAASEQAAKVRAARELAWWLEVSSSSSEPFPNGYRLWWPGAARGQAAAMLAAIVGAGADGDGNGGGGSEQLLRLGRLPPPSLLLHLPALLEGRPPLPAVAPPPPPPAPAAAS